MATLDSVRALKLETPAEGGTQQDYFPTEVNTLQDALAAAGYYIDGPSASAADKAVLIDRAASGSLRLTDNTTSHVLGELVSSTSGQVGSHNALLDVIHFLGEGPGDGYASGAYCADTYNGLLRVSSVWYTDSTQAHAIVGRSWTYAGLQVATEKLTLYAKDGATIVRTVTDTYSYSGSLRIGRTRTWGTT